MLIPRNNRTPQGTPLASSVWIPTGWNSCLSIQTSPFHWWHELSSSPTTGQGRPHVRASGQSVNPAIPSSPPISTGVQRSPRTRRSAPASNTARIIFPSPLFVAASCRLVRRSPPPTIADVRARPAFQQPEGLLELAPPNQVVQERLFVHHRKIGIGTVLKRNLPKFGAGVPKGRHQRPVRLGTPLQQQAECSPY